MILSFQEQFKDAIISGSKVTTIRQDKTKRWRAGLSIQFWRGSPRNTSQNPYQFGVAICSFVRPIKIIYSKRWIHFDYKWCSMRHHKKDIERLIIGEGFATPKEFFQFFKDTYEVDYFEGVLIEWHNFTVVKEGEK